MLLIKVIYAANILVAGWISISCLASPKTAEQTVFTGAFQFSESFRLVGALWFGIFLLSVFGLFYPKQMSLILLFQFIYKSTWLIFAALPALMKDEPFPKSMSVFFVIWVVVLPFVIPWKSLFS